MVQGISQLFKGDRLRMEIWENPHKPGFKFQQYRSDTGKTCPYEALAVLKNFDGTPLANDLYFDTLRNMDPAWQLEVDRYLVPLAILEAAGKKRLPVAVNVHLTSLIEDKFMSLIDAVMQECGLTHKDVMFEIVEPHVPTPDQAAALRKISSLHNKQDGFVLIIDDHSFKDGHERLQRLAPLCEMVKIDMEQASDGVAYLRQHYPHLEIVLERVTFNDREQVFAMYPGVSVQGI